MKATTVYRPLVQRAGPSKVHYRQQSDGRSERPSAHRGQLSEAHVRPLVWRRLCDLLERLPGIRIADRGMQARPRLGNLDDSDFHAVVDAFVELVDNGHGSEACELLDMCQPSLRSALLCTKSRAAFEALARADDPQVVRRLNHAMGGAAGHAFNHGHADLFESLRPFCSQHRLAHIASKAQRAMVTTPVHQPAHTLVEVEVPMGAIGVATHPDEVLHTRHLTSCSAITLCTHWSQEDQYFRERLLYHIPGSNYGSTDHAPLAFLNRYDPPATLIDGVISDIDGRLLGTRHQLCITFGGSETLNTFASLLSQMCEADDVFAPFPLLQLIGMCGGLRLPNGEPNPAVQFHHSSEVRVHPDGKIESGDKGKQVPPHDMVAVVQDAIDRIASRTDVDPDMGDLLRELVLPPA